MTAGVSKSHRLGRDHLVGSSGPSTSPHPYRGGRGVSPIIATILLVAITVVLAAVLYLVVSGVFTSADHSPHLPVALAVTESWKGNCSSGSTSLAEYRFGVDATSSTLTTQEIGLQVVDVSNNIVPLGRATVPTSGTCPATPSSGGPMWVAVLESPTSQPLAYWDSSAGGAWSAFPGGPSLPQTFSQGQSILVIAGADLSNDHLNGISLTSTPVSVGGGGF